MLRYLQETKDILRRHLYFPRNEDGFLLVLTMFVLVVLTLIGISATNLSRIELQIAGNDRVYKETFYQADGGTEVGALLLEENLACPNGFSTANRTIGSVTVTDILNFGLNEIDPGKLSPAVPYPSDTTRHIKYNADANVAVYDETLPHTNLYFFGTSTPMTGTAQQMISGYEGIGYSAASGTQLVVNIDSQHNGVQNSLSNIRVVWRHISGREGTCKY